MTYPIFSDIGQYNEKGVKEQGNKTTKPGES